jgi:hypothetical protein
MNREEGFFLGKLWIHLIYSLTKICTKESPWWNSTRGLLSPRKSPILGPQHARNFAAAFSTIGSSSLPLNSTLPPAPSALQTTHYLPMVTRATRLRHSSFSNGLQKWPFQKSSPCGWFTSGPYPRRTSNRISQARFTLLAVGLRLAPTHGVHLTVFPMRGSLSLLLVYIWPITTRTSNRISMRGSLSLLLVYVWPITTRTPNRISHARFTLLAVGLCLAPTHAYI